MIWIYKQIWAMNKEQVLELINLALKEYMKVYDRGVTEAFVIFGLVILFLGYEIYKLRRKSERIFRILEANTAQNTELLALAKSEKEVSKSEKEAINERLLRLQIDIDFLKKNAI